MMLGFLLARAGVETLVLEKHADFFRDFRGDTIHPSTLEIIYELGLLDDFLSRPHQKVTRIAGQIGAHTIELGDFSHLATHCKFIAFMPQWDFLDFLADHAETYPNFRLMRRTEVVDLIEEDSQIIGVRARQEDGEIEVRCDLVVGADGRRSTVRERAGLKVREFGAPMDVFWMRISRKPGDPSNLFGHIEAGQMFVMLDRGDYWQCAYLIAKGQEDKVRRAGLERFRQSVLELSPWLGDRVRELKTWDEIKLLTVAVDRLEQWWKPGLLCIGDAAHAMSPVGGVGINLAIQDAVAAANILAEPLAENRVTSDDLKAVQKRREFPTRVIQRMQIFVQDRVIRNVLSSTERPIPPWPVQLLNRFPYLRRFPARLVGIGVRPEHVRTAAK